MIGGRALDEIGRVVDLLGPSFLNVGLALAHKDGTGFDIKLDAVPVTGQVVLRLKRHSAGQDSVDRP